MAGEHLHPVAQHHRDPLPVPLLPPSLVDVHHFEDMTASRCAGRDDGKGLGTEQTPGSGHELHSAHRGIVVPPMRPGTVLAIVLLLVALTIAAAVFVIQLLSVT